MTEKSNKTFIQRLKAIYDKTHVEPDWTSIINKEKEKKTVQKTLQQKAIEASNKRSEIAGTHNTKWMPLDKEDDNA